MPGLLQLMQEDALRIKCITVSTYEDMLVEADGDQILLIGVLSDTVNMGGDKGAYIYIPSFGIGQIAINFS